MGMKEQLKKLRDAVVSNPSKTIEVTSDGTVRDPSETTSPPGTAAAEAKPTKLAPRTFGMKAI
jgi:hypothetical protein